MKITYPKIIFLLSILLLGACNIFQKRSPRAEVTTIDPAAMEKILEAINKNKQQSQEGDNYDTRAYQPSYPKQWDLVNTDLRVSFDYEKAQLIGHALITLTPHAYTQDSIVLDARGMKIEEIYDGDSRGLTPLKYKYNDTFLTIYLRYEVNYEERKKVSIHYIAKPNEIMVKGSSAITADKGLYFINNEGKDSTKPRQIWTQGETESNSCWFPTIDKPNQKMTQSIYITLKDTNDITLSNGIFKGRTKNNDGTVTDCWVQKVPAAPYLTMMAIGKFYVEHDKWRNLEVNYYVEPEYKPYAKLIFGRTPEMMEFFSKRLGVDFPWEKYSQVVVRDFVSGSMENASATLHGEFMQYDSRTYIDDNKEQYISHELFHQWFGDLVTCESWSNLPLNESFATYGEYLWIEYSQGKMAADQQLEEDRNQYLSEASFKQESLIRFHYEDKEDMFDRHSYQKGGCILHILRKQLGDDVFFRGLKLYLEKNKFKSVEVHDFRLAMEEASGQDLNWFFNQWFLRAGHPKVTAGKTYNINEKKLSIQIDFARKDETSPRKFTLPMQVDFYFKDSVIRKMITLNDWNNAFDFNFNEEPLLVNIDAERTYLWEINYTKSKDEWIYQIMHAPLYADKMEAITYLQDDYNLTTNEKYMIIDYCFNHSYWGVKAMAVELLEFMKPEDLQPYFNKISQLILNEKTSSLRVGLLDILDKMNDQQNVIPVLRACTNDSSYWVMSTALNLLRSKDLGTTLKICQANEYINNSDVVNVINEIYSKDSAGNHANYFYKSLKLAKGYEMNIRRREVENYLMATTVQNAYETILQISKLRSTLLDLNTGTFLPDTKNYFETQRVLLADFMSRAKYTEEGYKEAKNKLDLYDLILGLLQ